MANITKHDIRKSASEGANFYLRDPITHKIIDVVVNADESADYSLTPTFHMQGMDSPAYRRAVAHRSALRQNRRKQKDVPTGAIILEIAEGMYDDECRNLSAVVDGWSNVEDDKGPIEFSREAAYKLFSDYPWMKEQAEAFISDRANFLGNDETP
tara:strand:+ start:9788 stop:10252 length:465 start_codon:yes stop_codon:yes gene_type:complete